jgi:hypothetical protein
MPRPQLSPKVPYCRFLLQSSAGRDCKMAILCYLNLMKIYYLKIVPDRRGSFSYGGGRPCEVGKPSLWYRFTSTSRHPIDVDRICRSDWSLFVFWLTPPSLSKNSISLRLLPAAIFGGALSLSLFLFFTIPIAPVFDWDRHMPYFYLLLIP